MKITRIQRIRGHRVFRDFVWPSNGLPDFGRFNLIYGWNGAGKTTISNLFRHLQRKEAITEGDVQFLIEGSVVQGSSLATTALPQVKVFNRDTVSRLVFESPDQQFPPIYVIGEESGQKQQKIEALKQELAASISDAGSWVGRKSSAESAFESFCSDQAQSIKNLLTVPGGGRYNNYNKADFKRTADSLVAAAAMPTPLTAETREKYLATKSGAAMDKVPLLSLRYPDLIDLTGKVRKLLEKSVLSNILEELTTDPKVASWAGEGLTLHTGERATDTCRFCKQPLSADRLKHLQAHFNDEFKQFQGAIDDLIASVVSAKDSLASLSPPNKSLLYPHLAQEYEKQVNTLLLQSNMVKAYLDALKAALLAKKEEPFTTLELDSFLTNKTSPREPTGTLEKVFQIILAGFSAISASLGKNAFDRINSLIAAHNQHTDNFAGEVDQARKALEKDEVLAALADYQAKKQSISEAESGLAAVKGTTEGIRAKIAALEQDIRNHRIPADELNKEMATYLGRDELRFETKDTGYTISRNGQPASHLSEGERTAIAFMYFLKSLSGEDFDLKRGIVVVDDPVSSLDANSLYSAFGFMKARTEKAGQLFVLTHNFTFFRQVKNWFNYIEKLRGRKPDPAKLKHVRFYMLKAPVTDGQRNAQIVVLDDLLHEYESEYHYLFRTVYEVAHRQATAQLADYYGLPNTGRRLLETVLAFKYPEKSGELYQQLMGVEGFDEAKKARIIRFTNTYSHNNQIEDPEHDLSILAETPNILSDILSLIEHVDADHYKGMVNSVAPPVVPAGSG